MPVRDCYERTRLDFLLYATIAVIVIPKMAIAEENSSNSTKENTSSALVLGRGGEWWDTALILSLGIAALAAVIVLIATAGSIIAHKREAETSANDLERYKVATAENVAKAHERTASLENEASQARASIAEANAQAAEAVRTAEGERLARVKLEVRLAPRRLSQEEQNALADKLAAFKDIRATVTAAPSTPESEMFSRWLAAPLKQAGWNVEILPGSPTAIVLFPQGVIIRYGVHASPEAMPPSPAAEQLASELNALGIAASALPGEIGPATHIEIVVSSK